MTRAYAAAELQREISARVDLLCRWTGAIRHDVANVILPSQDLAQPAMISTSDPSLERFVHQTLSLREQLEWSRDVLGLIRASRPNDPSQTDVSEWWTGFASMGRSIFSANVPIALDYQVEGVKLAVSPQTLSRIFMAAFLAIDFQLSMPRQSKVRIEKRNVDKPNSVTIRVVVEGEPCKAMVLPDVAQELLRSIAGRMQFGTDGTSACWIDLTLPTAG